MILKYKVPKEYRKLYDNKKVIYCKLDGNNTIRMSNGKWVCKVEMLGLNKTNIFVLNELELLNIIDKIKLKLGGNLKWD